MPYDASFNTDFPVLTSEDEVARLAERYRQDSEARSGSSTPSSPVAALTPTPAPSDEFEYTGSSAPTPAPTAPVPTPTTAPGAGSDLYPSTPAPAPTATLARRPEPVTPATPAPVKEGEEWRNWKSPSGVGHPIGPPIDLSGAASGPEKATWANIALRGALRLGEDTKQSAAVAQGKTPTKSKTPEEDYEKPFEYGDFLSPTTLAEKLVFATVRSGAQIPAGIIGALGGAAVGSLAGPVGGAIGGVGGGSALMGAVAGLQAIGPAMVAELEKTPDDPSGASDRAINEAIKSGAITAASMAVFGGVTPFKQLLTGAFTKAAATRAAAAGGTAAERAAAETAAQETMKAATPGFRQQIGAQAVGQPAVVAGGTAIANVAEGKPIGEGVPESIPGAIANVGVAALTHGAGHLVPGRRGADGPRGAVEQGPATSTGDPAVKAATEQALALPPPSIENRPPVINVPPEPGQTFTGDVIPPRPGTVDRPPLSEPAPATLALTPPSPENRPPVINVPPGEGQRFTSDVIPPVEGTIDRPPLRPSPEAPPVAAEALTPAPPAPEPSIPPTPPPARSGGERATTMREAAPISETARPEFTTEPDHLDTSRSVAKNAAGDVVGKGATIEEALGDARARQGAPYEEQASPAEVAAAREPVAPSPTVTRSTPGKSAREIVNEPGAEPITTPLPPKSAPINADLRPLKGEPPAATRARATSKAKAEQAKPTEQPTPTPTPTPAQPTTVVKRPTPRREVVVGKRGEGVVSEEQPGAAAPKPTTVGEELQQRQLARKRGEQVAEGPPKVTKATQRAELIAREVAADVEEAGERRGRAPTRGTPVEELGESETEGITPTEGGIAETRAKTTTDKDLHYGDLLHDVLQGNKTVDEAATAAGTKEPGTRGRPRRNKDLAEYIDKRIEQAEARNETDRQHLDRLSRTLVADNKLTPARRQATLKKINKDLEDLGLDTHSDLQTARIEKYNAETDARNAARGRSETERERLDELRTMRDQLRGGATEGEPKGVGAPSRDTVRGYNRGQRLLAKILAPRINAKVQARLERNIKAGTSDSFHDYLHDIADDTFTKAAAPHMAATARRLLEILPDDITVTSFDRLAKTTGRPRIAEAGQDYSGMYYPSLDTIAIKPGIKNMAEILTHESFHVGTYKYLEHLGDKIRRGDELTPREQKHVDALNAIETELSSVFTSIDEVPRSAREHQELEYTLDAGGNETIARERHEILSQVLSNPEVISVLARTPATAEFMTEMQALGYGKPTTVWQAVKGFLKDILGFKSDSVFDQMFHPLTDIVERGAKFRQETVPPKFVPPSKPTDFMPPPSERSILGGGAERRGGLPTDALPSEWARERLRPFGEAMLGAPLSDRAQQAADLVREKVAGSGTTSTFLKTVLPAMPTTAIAKTFRNVIPAATAVRDAWAKTSRAADDFYTKYGNQVQDWTRQLKYGRDVAKVMNDATLNRAYITAEPGLFRDRNQHLTADEMTRAEAVRDDFLKLTPEKQQLYNDVRNYYRETHDETRRLEYEDVARRALPEATEEQIQKLGEQLRTRKGIQDVIDNADHDAMSKLFSERWENSRATVREIAKFQQQGFVEGDYFPLRRYGNYVLRYGEFGTPTYGVEMFERSSEAKARRAELQQQFANDKDPIWHDVRISDVLSKAAKPARREFIPESVFTDMERALVRRGASDVQIEHVKEAYAHALLQRATHSEGAMSRARRSYVEGPSTDAGRVLWNHFLSTGRRRGHLIHGAEEVEAFRQAEQQTHMMEGATGSAGTAAEIARSQAQLDALKQRPDATPEDIQHAQQQHDWLVKPPSGNDAMRARTVLEELKARRAPIDGDSSDTLLGRSVGRFTKASFVYHLARPAHLALQVAEAHANAQSLLGARYGHVQTSIALAKAMREVGPTAMAKGFRNMLNATRGEMQHNDWNMSDVLTQRMAKSRPGNAAYGAAMQELMNVAHDYGLIDHSRAREIQRLAGNGAFEFGDPTGGKHGWTNVPSNMMNLFAAGEHAVDGMNRAVTLKAGFDLAMRGKDINNEAHVRTAIHEAVGFAEDAQPVYGAWNTPRIAGPRGPLQGDLAPAIMQYKLYGMHMYSVMGNLVRQAANHPAERAEALKALAGLVATHSLLAGATATMFGLPVVAALGAWDLISGKEKPHNYETDARQWLTAVGGETFGRFASSGVYGLAGVSQQPSTKLANMVNVPEVRSFDKAGMGQFILQAMSGASGDVAAQIFQGMHHVTTGEWGKAATELAPRVIGDPVKAYGLATHGVTDARGRTVMPASQVSTGQVLAKAVGFNPTEPTLARERRYAEEELHGEVEYARRQAVDRYVRSGGRDMSGVRAYLANPEYRQLSPLKYDQLQNELKKERQRVTHPQLYGMIPPKKTEQRYIKETRFQ